MITAEEKVKAAYALNLCTVSVSQIADYNDIYILQQEYDSILNGLNLERIPKDEALLKASTHILDTIAFNQITEKEKQVFELEYQHKVKNAIFDAIPKMGMIFASGNPIAMGVTLATQVGIGYMNYRRNKSEYQLEKKKEELELEKSLLDQMNGLRKQLFETAWNLAETYKFPDEYRLTESQISEYNNILTEINPLIRYNRLDSIKSNFLAYPQFWYQIGSAANSVYRKYGVTIADELCNEFKTHAIDCFEHYRELNSYNLMRHDVITASWALEYVDLLDISVQSEKEKASELIAIAEKYAGNALDVVEMCAYAYLKVGDYKNAARALHKLTNSSYNSEVNARILSGLYIQQDMANGSRGEGYKQYQLLNGITNPKYLLPFPDSAETWSTWTPEWDRSVFTTAAPNIKSADKPERWKADFYKVKKFASQPFAVVYKSQDEIIADYLVTAIQSEVSKADYPVPPIEKCDYGDYKKRVRDFERGSYHVIFLGEAKENKSLCKNIEWVQKKYGIKFGSSGLRSVITVNNLKGDEFTGFKEYAKQNIDLIRTPKDIPTGIDNVEFTLFKDIYSDMGNDAIDIAAGVMATVITSPLLIVGGALEAIVAGGQNIVNGVNGGKIRELQFLIAIEKFLISKLAADD